MVHKVLENKSPKYLYSMFTMDYTITTRQATRREIRQDSDTPELGLTMDSFRWRAAKDYNRIPAEIRRMKSLKILKTNLWKRIISIIPIYR